MLTNIERHVYRCAFLELFVPKYSIVERKLYDLSLYIYYSIICMLYSPSRNNNRFSKLVGCNFIIKSVYTYRIIRCNLVQIAMDWRYGLLLRCTEAKNLS